MKLDLLDRLERLHAEATKVRSVLTVKAGEWDKEGIEYAVAALPAVPALVASLRLAVEALEQREAIERAVYAKAGECGIALAKIESLMATEEAT